MGRNWAITIGINQYKNLPRLNHAQRDAELMRDFFRDDLGVNPVYHFAAEAAPIPTGDGLPLDASPSFANLKRFLRVQFESAFLRAGDNLWFFFAGHGVRFREQDYLLPIDADPGDTAERSTWIPLSYVTDRLRRSGADNVVMLIDACRDGSGTRSATVLGFGSERQQGVITLFACSPSEVSYEFSQIQQGAFTYALLEGLRIEGEGNCATVERLYHRLRQSVPQITQRYTQRSQTPYGVIEPPTKLHLILLPKKANLADILMLKYDAQRAEIDQNWTLAKQAWIRVLAISGADTDAIEGIERIARQPNGRGERPFAPTSSATGTQDSRSLTLGESSTPTSSATQQDKHENEREILTFRFEVVTVNDKGLEANHKPGEAEYFIENLGEGVTLEMVLIPGGRFLMGSPDEEGRKREKPQHWVNIQPFAMAKYPVTQAQWQKVAKLPKLKIELNPDPSQFKGTKLPVEQVNWHETIEFCARLSATTDHDYRLPSEAEWEYACRAGTTTPFYFGERITSDFANFNGNGTYGNAPKGKYRGKTTEVGQFPPNAFGLYDMHGNVWEWCQDCFHENYKGAPTDNSAWLSGNDNQFRILRGGSWYFNPRNCRSAFRNYFSADSRYHYYGFRVVYFSATALL